PQFSWKSYSSGKRRRRTGHRDRRKSGGLGRLVCFGRGTAVCAERLHIATRKSGRIARTPRRRDPNRKFIAYHYREHHYEQHCRRWWRRYLQQLWIPFNTGKFDYQQWPNTRLEWWYRWRGRQHRRCFGCTTAEQRYLWELVVVVKRRRCNLIRRGNAAAEEQLHHEQYRLFARRRGMDSEPLGRLDRPEHHPWEQCGKRRRCLLVGSIWW